MNTSISDALGGNWLLASLGAYGLTALVSGAGELSRRKTVRTVGLVCLGLAMLLNGAAIVSLGVTSGRAPFKTLYETFFLYAFCIAAVSLVLIALHRLTLLTPFAAAGALLCLISAYLRPDLEFALLPPALQSGWFVPHVVTYFVAYAGLFAAFVLAILSLFKARGQDTLPEGSSDGNAPLPLEEAAHKAAVFGFVALTFGLAMGAAWGKSAWGDYWQWDPKENWAFITWLAYLAYLHLRLQAGWRGRRVLWLNLACFAAVIFTYLGMNLLPTARGSLHVYQ
jgi:cytochrome c-type biogenesis protein CcsB